MGGLEGLKKQGVEGRSKIRPAVCLLLSYLSADQSYFLNLGGEGLQSGGVRVQPTQPPGNFTTAYI